MTASIISAIEHNAELLRELDADPRDQTITESEFSKVGPSAATVKALAGRDVASWEDFKGVFIEPKKTLDLLGLAPGAEVARSRLRK